VRRAAVLFALCAACATSRGRLDEPRGFPGLDHTWSPADFEQMGAEADRLSGSDVASLPRRGSPVFSRIVDLTVGPDVADATQPLSWRLEVTRGYLTGMSRVMKAYSRAGPSFLPELREVLMSFFANGCDMIQLMSTVNAMPDKDLANPRVVHEGYANMQAGVRQLISGIVTMLHPREGIPEVDRIRYAGLLARHLPHLMPLFSAAERETLHSQIEGLIAREQNASVRERLSTLE